MTEQVSESKGIQNYPRPPVKPLCAKCFSPWRHRSASHSYEWYKTTAEVHESANKGCGLFLQLLRTGTYTFYQHPSKIVEADCGQIYAHLSLDKAIHTWTLSACVNCYEDPSHYDTLVDEREKVKKKWSASAYLFSYSSPEHEYFEKIPDDSRIPYTMALCKEWQNAIWTMSAGMCPTFIPKLYQQG
ncbi:hypothetical protein FSHL1_009849 [Fusarium sambucinum]